jgi:hypothetical protein
MVVLYQLSYTPFSGSPTLSGLQRERHFVGQKTTSTGEHYAFSCSLNEIAEVFLIKRSQRELHLAHK